MEAEAKEDRDGNKGWWDALVARRLMLRQELRRGTGRGVFGEGEWGGGVGAGWGTCCDSDPQTHVFLVKMWCS